MHVGLIVGLILLVTVLVYEITAGCLSGWRR